MSDAAGRDRSKISWRTILLGKLCIDAADIRQPGAICMSPLPGIPGVVGHFRTPVKIGRKGDVLLLCKIHHSPGLRLPVLVIGMRAILRIREIAVQIYPMGIMADSSGKGLVASRVGAIGIGVGIDED